MVGVALLNAAVRGRFLVPRLGVDGAHVASTATLLGALGLLVRRHFDRAPGHRRRELGATGLIWAGATVGFELGFGRYVAGVSWSDLIAQYDVRAGRVWISVPLFLLIAPLVSGHGGERGNRSSSRDEGC